MINHNNYQIMTNNNDFSADKNQTHEETINYHLNGQEQVTEFYTNLFHSSSAMKNR